MLRSVCQRWLSRLASPRRPRPARPAPRRPLYLEGLENRRVPACMVNDPFLCAPLPSEGTVEHFHPHLTIIINGQQQVIPANTNIQLDANGNPTSFGVIHTHDTTGLIHVESPSVHTFFLKDFFNIWGQPFDQNHILGFSTPAGHPITMTVRSLTNPNATPVPNNQLGDFMLRDEGAYSGPDDPARGLTRGLEVGDDIVITATNATPAGSSYFAVGGNGHVRLYRDADASLIYDIAPFGPSYTGGVSVAVGDVNHDGVKDLVVSTTSGGPQVKVYNGQAIANGTLDPGKPDGALLSTFNAFDPKFNTGVNVAVGDISKNGFADIVTGAAAGNPDVRVFSGQDIAMGRFNPSGSSMLAQWFPYGLQFNVGANVAVGDLNHDGFADVVTGATAGNPDVRVYNGQDIANHTFNPAGSSLLWQFFAYGLQFNVGAFVAVGDVNGDGNPELITGATAGNPHVKVYDGAAFANHTFNPSSPDNSVLNSFFPYALQFNVGAAVAVADFENNGHDDILTGASVGSPHFRVIKGTASGNQPPSVNNMEGIPVDIQGGIRVGA